MLQQLGQLHGPARCRIRPNLHAPRRSQESVRRRLQGSLQQELHTGDALLGEIRLRRLLRSRSQEEDLNRTMAVGLFEVQRANDVNQQ